MQNKEKIQLRLADKWQTREEADKAGRAALVAASSLSEAAKTYLLEVLC